MSHSLRVPGVLCAASLAGLLAIAGCAPAPTAGPSRLDAGSVNAGSGVGLGSYADYETQRRARDAALRGGIGQTLPTLPDSRVISTAELSAAGLPVAGGVALPAPGFPVPAAPFDAMGAASVPSIPVPPPVASAPLGANGSGISDEQDFDAVAARQTIESDRERLERQAQAYQVIAPVALPQRDGQGGPNIVAYALSTSNAVGQRVYERSGFNAQNRSARACSRYASPDLAQEDFLANGGPQTDRKTLDPDGDGYACGWDPRPYRTVRN